MAFDHYFPWGVGVVYPKGPSSILNITVCDGGDDELGVKSPVPRGTLTERLRLEDRAARGLINGKRALKRKNLRRARYWANVAEHWLERRREIFNYP